GRALEDPGQAGDRRFRFAFGNERGGQAGDDFVVAGRQLERPAKSLDARQARLEKRPSERMGDPRRTGRHLRRRLQGLKRLFATIELTQDEAVEVPQPRIAGSCLHRFFQRREQALPLAGLVGGERILETERSGRGNDARHQDFACAAGTVPTVGAVGAFSRIHWDRIHFSPLEGGVPEWSVDWSGWPFRSTLATNSASPAFPR